MVALRPRVQDAEDSFTPELMEPVGGDGVDKVTEPSMGLRSCEDEVVIFHQTVTWAVGHDGAKTEAGVRKGVAYGHKLKQAASQVSDGRRAESSNNMRAGVFTYVRLMFSIQHKKTKPSSRIVTVAQRSIYFLNAPSFNSFYSNEKTCSPSTGTKRTNITQHYRAVGRIIYCQYLASS